MFRAIVLSIILGLAILQSPARACCMVFSFWQLKDTTFIDGDDDPSIAFTVFKYNINERTFEEKGKDTIYQSEMIADLKRSYDNSAAVVVASISGVKEFVLEPDANGTYFYAESVTVKIENVIKGTIDEMERTFISPVSGKSFKYIYNYENGETIPIIQQVSLQDPGYKAIDGKRFLIFLNNKESSDSNLTIQKPGPCNFSLNKYIVDKNNRVSFDGLEIDSITNKISKTSLLTIDLDKIVQAFPNHIVDTDVLISTEKNENSTPVKLDNRTIKQVRSSKYQGYCDLMGKRVPANISGRHTKASQLIISVDEGRRNNAKMILR